MTTRWVRQYQGGFFFIPRVSIQEWFITIEWACWRWFRWRD